MNEEKNKKLGRGLSSLLSGKSFSGESSFSENMSNQINIGIANKGISDKIHQLSSQYCNGHKLLRRKESANHREMGSRIISETIIKNCFSRRFSRLIRLIRLLNIKIY